MIHADASALMALEKSAVTEDSDPLGASPETHPRSLDRGEALYRKLLIQSSTTGMSIRAA